MEQGDAGKAVFLALVQEQYKGGDPARARRAVARRFGVREAAVCAIEAEGLSAGWPPLDDG